MTRRPARLSYCDAAMVVTKEQGWRAHLGDDVVGEDAAVGPATDAEALRINELHGVVRRGSVWSRTMDHARGRWATKGQSGRGALPRLHDVDGVVHRREHVAQRGAAPVAVQRRAERLAPPRRAARVHLRMRRTVLG